MSCRKVTASKLPVNENPKVRSPGKKRGREKFVERRIGKWVDVHNRVVLPARQVDFPFPPPPH